MPQDMVDLYLRLSVDRDGKDSLERQEADLRAWAAREGLTVRKVWADAGKSGYKANVVRADFDAAIAAVSKGEVGTLAVWKLDRLSRRGAGQVGLALDKVEAAGGRLFFLRDSLDSTVRGHRMVIVLVSEQALAESENTSLRVKARIAADRAKGIPPKGLRPVGWEPGGIKLREAEAGVLREAFRLVTEDGASLTAVTHFLNEAGLRTDTMGIERQVRGAAKGVKKLTNTTWTITTTRQVLLRERNAGLIDGKASQIEPIVPLEVFENARLSVRGKLPQGPKTQSLLGGIMRCLCGESMVSTVSYSQRKGRPRYVYRLYKCRMVGFDKSRKHPAIQGYIADEKVVGLLLPTLGYWREHMHDSSARDLAVLRLRMGQIREQITEGAADLLTLSGAARAAVRYELGKLEQNRVKLEEELEAALAEATPLGELVGAENVQEDDGAWRTVFSDEGFHQAWGSWDIDRKRALVRRLFRLIELHPGRGAERVHVYPVTFPSGSKIPS